MNFTAIEIFVLKNQYFCSFLWLLLLKMEINPSILAIVIFFTLKSLQKLFYLKRVENSINIIEALHQKMFK